MNRRRASDAFSERHGSGLVCVDSHTAGEATRLVVEGFGPVPGRTMREKRTWFSENLDHVRTLLTREPRGHRDLLAAAVTEPVTPGADFGLIFMDARRYPFLCGHATMGAVTTLVELGLVRPAGPAGDQVVVDTPSGPLTTRIVRHGDKVSSVSWRSVPSFVHQADVHITVPQLGRIRVDTVCVGGFFVMVDLVEAGLESLLERRTDFIPLGMRIIEEANRQLEVAHPLRPEVDTIDVVEFYRELGPGRGTSVVVYGESHMDRCPCGTGTTAKTVLMHRKGRLVPGDTYVNLGPLGTSFTARLVEETEVGGLPAAVVEVEGGAAITGLCTFIVDKDDPFPEGFLP